MRRNGLSAAEANILDDLFNEAESMEEEEEVVVVVVAPPVEMHHPQLPDSVEEGEVEAEPPPPPPPPSKKAKKEPHPATEEWGCGTVPPAKAYLSQLNDRTLGRLQRTCRSMRRLVSQCRIWEERTQQLLERSFSSNIMERSAASQWEKRSASLSPKARYDLLKFYKGQVGLAMAKKNFTPSHVMKWAEQWHPLEKDEQRDAYYRDVLNRQPPRAQRYWRPVQDAYLKSKGESESHLIFTGGVLYVPASRQAELRRQYLADLRAGIPTYIGERRTAVFQLFGDLDMSDAEIPSQERLDEYYACMQEVVAELFPELNDYERRLVVCQAPVSFEKRGSRHYKTGAHVYWPGIMVTAAIALLVRKAIIKRLRERFGERTLLDNPWVKVLDEAVYTSNGLRMFGSFKADKCRECRGTGRVISARAQDQALVRLRKQPNEVHPTLKGQTKFDTERTAESEKKKKKKKKKRKKPDADAPKEPCGLCLETGKTHVGRLYEPILVLDGSGEPDEDELQSLLDDPEALYDACTLRHPTDTPTVDPVVPEWLKNVKESDLYDGPSEDELRRLRRKNQLNPSIIAIKGGRIAPRDPSYRPVKQTLRIEESRTRALLMGVLTTAHPYMRGGPAITRIEYESTGKYYIVKTDCKWCPNKGDEHNSSTIWFRVGYHTITTHCFNRLSTIRPVGGCACRDMERFDAFGTPIEIKELLFPDMLENEREHALLAYRYSAPTPKKEDENEPADVAMPAMVWNTRVKEEPKSVDDEAEPKPPKRQRQQKRKRNDRDDSWGGGEDCWSAGSAFD